MKLPKFNEECNTNGYYPYTGYDTRGIIHEGYFRHLRGDEIYSRGQEVLLYKKCKFTNTPNTGIVDYAEVSYWFNDRPIYRVWIVDGGGYIMPMLHTSLYDQILKQVKVSKEDQEWLDNWNKKYSNWRKLTRDKQHSQS